MGALDPITRTCTPRADVLGGGLTDQHFAAQLDQVVRNAAAYPIYGEADRFFELTYPTAGLRTLLARCFGRLAGAKVAGAEHGVIRSETSFGGGKTHGLMAVYHLATGARPPNVADFVDPALLPTDCQIAAVVADTLDPVAGLVTNGIRTRTLWGELAAQLGPAAYEQLRANDQEMTAPGKETWRAALSERPTIVVIDELAAHLRQLVTSGNADARRMAGAVPVFLKNLFELASGNSNMVVIVTLATAANAFGKETTDLSEVMDSAVADLRSAVDDTVSVTARVGSIVRPAEDAEIGEILKRRLFSAIDPGAAQAAGDAYRALYERLTATGERLSGGAEQPATYGEFVQRSYPFHPELIRVLDKRLGAIPSFQRARGALRLLAEVLAGVWDRDERCEVLNCADVDLGRDDVRSALTTGLGRPEFDAVAAADAAGPSSHAATVDEQRFGGRAPFATRTARTVFLHSLELTAQAGSARVDRLLGTLREADDPGIVDEALAALDRDAWYLDYQPATGRARFVTEPQPAKIIDDEARNVAKTMLRARLDDLVEKLFASDGAIKAVHFPTGPAEVPDVAQLRLVVPHHDDLHVTARDASPPPARLVEMAERAGAAEGIRRMRNALVFVVADTDQRDAMRETVRRAIAVERIVGDADRMRGFADTVQAKLRSQANQAKLEARIAVTRCYRHVYFPATDRANSNLRHHEMTPREQGDASGGVQTKIVQAALAELGKVRTAKLATNYVRDKTWPRDRDSVSTEQVADAFWADHGLPFVLDQTLLRDVIRDGVKHGDWVLCDVQAQRAWGAEDAPAPVEISSEHELWRREAAEREGLLGRAPRVEDVVAALNGRAQITGGELRAAVEQACGREPAKRELLDVLARASEGGSAAEAVVVAGTPAAGDKALTPAQVRKATLDAITVLAPAEAQRLSIVVAEERRGIAPVEAQGTAGVAFAALADKIADSRAAGTTLLLIQASADPGEGVNDLALLGKALGQLPRHEIVARLDVELDFRGLSNGAEVTVAGPAADYQRIEDAFLGLARAARTVSGTLTLELRFAAAVSPTAPDFAQVRDVVVGLAPGELKLRAVLE